MRVIIFGATGMVGQGVLRACLLDDRVESVLIVGRTTSGVRHPKVREVLHGDFKDFSAIDAELTSLDACFYCLGVTSTGIGEEEYTRITYTYTLAAARAVAAHNPGLTFTYVSGEGTDSTEKGRSVWARVKGRTENELLAMDFHAYMFRPGYIQPLHGATSKTSLYRWMYRGVSWLYPVLRRIMPSHVTTTDDLGRAMIAVVGRKGSGEHILHSPEINRAAGA
ncbi:NAD-dependent epimerase/dehydratase family protein [Streptomyces sp. JH14]|uniref:NAD-dependent epimerase/dehydratase family protein n=1 Tax=Streptomyces sp. JH14 TaxID=2793630 RepID=UPI0023F73D17|nr:NAD-dependent epimerase/dehydratase family protein [Streptomyces sp. JH14]MDF6040616.1 NAD-dependent epimerase/dehydratase family protein [Streptomyces sp. JH14]